ncbi:branched-chain amino acid ABC transporter permease [Haladaptatus halobius]|uniref:branched-chain amino acid ABC transporter permease n=1 Tax=Haladaptatus halobius TaxID=2884875 RepID=UPI003F622119
MEKVRTRWKLVYIFLSIWLVSSIIRNPSLFAAQFVSGFVYGMILVMIALGLALILGLMGIINFAHGALFMLGAYLAFSVVSWFGLSFWAALIIAPLAIGLIGALMEVITLRPLHGSDPEAALLLTFGLTMMFEEAIRFVWGAQPKSYSTPSILTQPVNLGVTSVPSSRIFTVAIGMISLAVVYLLIVRTDFGLTIRAGVQDAEMTELAGVNLPIRFTAMFVIGAMLAGLAGVLRSAEVGLDPGMGGTFIIIVFVVIVIGGMGSFFGAIVGGLLIGWARFLVPGMLETAAYYTGIQAFNIQGIARVLPFLLMIIVLLDRPRGLFGEEGFLE